MMATIHVRPGEGQHNQMIDGDHVAKAAVHDARGAFEVFEVTAPAAPMAPPHVSPWTSVLYLMEGRITAFIDGATHEVDPQGLVIFPAGTPCTFRVIGETALFLAITSGDGAGQFFADFARAVAADRPAVESMAAIQSVTERHGVAVAGI